MTGGLNSNRIAALRLTCEREGGRKRGGEKGTVCRVHDRRPATAASAVAERGEGKRGKDCYTDICLPADCSC